MTLVINKVEKVLNEEKLYDKIENRLTGRRMSSNSDTAWWMAGS